MSTNIAAHSFFNPYGRYHGLFSPEQMAFNANLQEFANQIGVIFSLETNGQLSTEEAYQKILKLWVELGKSRLNPKVSQASETP